MSKKTGYNCLVYNCAGIANLYELHGRICNKCIKNPPKCSDTRCEQKVKISEAQEEYKYCETCQVREDDKVSRLTKLEQARTIRTEQKAITKLKDDTNILIRCVKEEIIAQMGKMKLDSHGKPIINIIGSATELNSDRKCHRHIRNWLTDFTLNGDEVSGITIVALVLMLTRVLHLYDWMGGMDSYTHTLQWEYTIPENLKALLKLHFFRHKLSMGGYNVGVHGIDENHYVIKTAMKYLCNITNCGCTGPRSDTVLMHRTSYIFRRADKIEDKKLIEFHEQVYEKRKREREEYLKSPEYKEHLEREEKKRQERIRQAEEERIRYGQNMIRYEQKMREENKRWQARLEEKMELENKRSISKQDTNAIKLATEIQKAKTYYNALYSRKMQEFKSQTDKDRAECIASGRREDAGNVLVSFKATQERWKKAYLDLCNNQIRQLEAQYP